MKELLGKLTASLVEIDHDVPQNLIEKINSNIKPPTELTADDVYIRAMYIVSDQVNSHGGRFPADEHSRLIEMLIDSPVLIGHRKDSLPIARNFHAETVERDGVNWVKAYFYWLKKGEKGEDLQKNIDAGIYKECSISFIFNFPECSICGSDIRQCRHRPFENYETENGETRQACFNYRQILKVLETSLVYRGSVRDTSITDKLFFDAAAKENLSEDKAPESIPAICRLWSLDSIRNDSDYLMMPAYDAMRVHLVRNHGNVRITDWNGVDFNSEIISRFISGLELPESNFEVECRLPGFCGKERKAVDEVVHYLNNEKSSVRRLEVKIVDLVSENGETFVNVPARERRRRLENLFAGHTALLIPVITAKGNNLTEHFGRCATRYGIEILEADTTGRFLLTNQKRIPAKITERKQTDKGYRYNLSCNVDGAPVVISESVFSNVGYEESGIVELEVFSINGRHDRLELSQPRIVGVEYGHGQPDDIGLILKSAEKNDCRSEYSLFQCDDDVILNLSMETGNATYRICRFDKALLEKGRWFMVGKINYHSQIPAGLIDKGPVTGEIHDAETVRVSLGGFLEGEFILRPAIRNGVRQYVFYKIDTRNSSSEQGDEK